MTVQELNNEQKKELKGNYLIAMADDGSFSEVADKDYDSPSYADMINVDEIVSDDMIYEYYEGIEFTNDDFFCTADKSYAG